MGSPKGCEFPVSGMFFANLREVIALILEHRREESLRALPPDAKQELVVIG